MLLNKVYCLFILLLLNVFMAKDVQPNTGKLAAEDTLYYMKRFYNSEPNLSREKLFSNSHLRAQLTTKQQIQWLILTANIANKLNDLALFESSLKDLYSYFDSELSAKKKAAFLSLLGHYNLKTGNYSQSIQFYRCALKFYDSEQFTLHTKYSLSNAYQMIKEFSRAEAIMLQIYEKIDDSYSHSWKGSISNALGIFSLERKDYKQAAKYFRQAMDFYQEKDNAIKEYNSGLNLLLTFSLSRDIDMYNRLYNRMERMGLKHNDNDRNIYLEFIARLTTQAELSNDDKQTINQRVEQIESSFIKSAITDYILPELGVEFAPVDNVVIKIPDWVNGVLIERSCDKIPTSFSNMK